MFNESVMPSNHLIFCPPLLILSSIFPSIRVFSNESALHIRWPKNWRFSFSIILSNDYQGQISFRIDWVDLLAVQGTFLESFPTAQFKSISSSVLSLLYCPTLTSIHDYWKNHSFDSMDLCCKVNHLLDCAVMNHLYKLYSSSVYLIILYTFNEFKAYRNM